MDAPLFEFLDAPTLNPSKFSRGEPLPPVQGSGPLSRHASWTGALKAQETRSANIVALRQLWRQPLTINEAAAILRLPVSSICSLKSAIESELEEVDHEIVTWGRGRKATKRTRWQLKQAQR